MTIESSQYGTLALPGFRGQEGFFLAYTQRIKRFTRPFQNDSVHSPGRINGNICRSFLGNFDDFFESVDFSSEFMCCEWNPLFPRFKASAVTLSGSQVGNALPLPRSKGGVFPFLLTSMGAPLLPANIRSEITGPTPYSATSGNTDYISMNHFRKATT
jgi:hypothetical protein